MVQRWSASPEDGHPHTHRTHTVWDHYLFRQAVTILSIVGQLSMADWTTSREITAGRHTHSHTFNPRDFGKFGCLTVCDLVWLEELCVWCVCVLKTTFVHVLSSCCLSSNHPIKCTVPIPHWVLLSVLFSLFMWSTKVLDIWKICTNVKNVGKVCRCFLQVLFPCGIPPVSNDNVLHFVFYFFMVQIMVQM